MSQCVPSWDLNDINPNYDLPRLDHEVTELKWKNGQQAMQGCGPPRVPDKPQSTTPTLPKYEWDKPRAAETLEAIVHQATLIPYLKPQPAVNDDELVPWLHHHAATVAAGGVNASATMTTDALVPSSNNRTDERSAYTLQSTKSVRDAGCSTGVGSCSGERRVASDRSSCRDKSVSETFGTTNTCDRDLSGRGFTSTSSGSPENTSSGQDCTKSTSPDDSVCHCRPQRGTNGVNEKKRGKGTSSMSSKRSRTAAIHNQSERKRRDKINMKMKTLQKLVPNSSKTDKASMLDEVIEYLKQLQSQVNMMSRMNMPSMMMPLAMQQQLHMSMMNSMGMGMGMGTGMGVIDMNAIGRYNIPAGFHPSAFMHMPPWNGHATDRVANANSLPVDPMSAFLACRSQPMSMDAYSKMVALFQHMQNQPCGPFPNN